MVDAVSYWRYPFFHNPTDPRYPQALSETAFNGRFDTSEASWRSRAFSSSRVCSVEAAAYDAPLDEETFRSVRRRDPARL